jgi:predicted RNA-binding Zn-ribbon protein involved in translation (DUF1610 family)
MNKETIKNKRASARLLDRVVKWLKRLFCHHTWLYNNRHNDYRTTRDCPKCGKAQVLCNNGGCHGETWWQNEATQRIEVRGEPMSDQKNPQSKSNPLHRIVMWICKYCGENEQPKCPQCVREDGKFVTDELVCEVDAFI